MMFAGPFSPQRISRLVCLQLVLTLAAAAAAFVLQGWPGALAAAYGGGTAVVNSGVLAWHIHRGKRTGDSDAYRALRSIYLAAVGRLIVVAALLAVGFAVLQLAPLALLTGFVAGQVGLLVSGLLNGGR